MQGASDFLTHIFNTLPADALMDLCQNSVANSANDQEVFKQLSKQLPAIKPNKITHLRATLASLKVQKNEMAQQTAEITEEDGCCCKTIQRMIEGYLEIGSPGRYIESLRKYFAFKGPIFVMNDHQGVADIVERGTLFSPGTFLNLTYTKESISAIKDNSLDLVTCFIGLHHCPVELLEEFLEEIYRVLRPGGNFVVRDHDATQELLPLVHFAHSIYNVGTGVSLKDELAEVRNFQPLSYWTEKVESVGFKDQQKRLLQQGDPTANTLIVFKKPITSKESVAVFAHNSIIGKKDYYRDLGQSYLTLPEWYLVDVAKDYGKFLEHTPWFGYPYWKSISLFWKNWYRSTMVTYNKCGFRQAFLSPYTLMNGVIGSVVTGIFGQLSLLAVVPRLMYPLSEAPGVERIGMLVVDVDNKIMSLDDRISIKEEFAHGIKYIETPRYLPFNEIIKKMAFANIEILEIAGQKEIQFKVRVLKATPDLCFQIPGLEKLYEYEVFGTDLKEVALNVSFVKINNVFQALYHHGIEVDQIYGY